MSSPNLGVAYPGYKRVRPGCSRRPRSLAIRILAGGCRRAGGGRRFLPPPPLRPRPSDHPLTSITLDRIWIYADESCLGNQFTTRANPGGAGGLIEYWQHDRWLRRDYWISEPDTTNNRMAIRSAVEGLQALRRPCEVVFTSDSQYLTRGMNEWVRGWEQRGWKRKGGPIENLELWQQLVRSALPHRLTWHWVRGHAGHPQNEYANHLATRAARELSCSDGLVDSGFGTWLQQEREKRARYFDFFEHAPPP